MSGRSRRGMRIVGLGVIMIGLACLGFGRERSVWQLGVAGIAIILAGGALVRSP